MIIAYKDDTLRVVLWDDNVDLVESADLKSGQVVRFAHGYTRVDQEGKVELHLGRKSQVEIDPEYVKTDDFPSLSKFVTKINAVTATQNNVNLVGMVKEV